MHFHSVSAGQEALEEVEAVPYHPWWPQDPSWLQSFLRTCASEFGVNLLESLADCFPLEMLEVLRVVKAHCAVTRQVLFSSKSFCSIMVGVEGLPPLLLGCLVVAVEVEDWIWVGEEGEEEEDICCYHLGYWKVAGFDLPCSAKPVVGCQSLACQV